MCSSHELQRSLTAVDPYDAAAAAAAAVAAAEVTRSQPTARIVQQLLEGVTASGHTMLGLALPSVAAVAAQQQ
jgi:hypothetical protein